MIVEYALKESIRQMMVLRNNQGDCLRARIALQKTGTVDCSESIIGLDFLVTFLSKTNASAFNEAKKQ